MTPLKGSAAKGLSVFRSDFYFCGGCNQGHGDDVGCRWNQSVRCQYCSRVFNPLKSGGSREIRVRVFVCPSCTTKIR